MDFTAMFDNDEITRKGGRPLANDLESSIQNSFVIDGVPDIKNWVFIPVIIKHKRPPGLKFNSKVIIQGEIQAGVDVYSYAMNFNQSYQVPLAAFPHQHTPSKMGSDKVFVQADGLTYNGKYKDYAIVDSRLPVSESVVFVGVKNPKPSNSEAYVSAYDSHGRLCYAHCLVAGSNPPEYRKCSGTIDLKTTGPCMYADTVSKASDLLYRETKSGDFVRTNDKVFLTFQCDFNDISRYECN